MENQSRIKWMFTKLSELALGGLLGELLKTMLFSQPWVAIIMGGLTLWISHLAGLSLLAGLIFGIGTFLIVLTITDFFLELTGKIRAAKIVFYDEEGKYIKKALPVCYYQDSNQVIYEIKAYARIVNFGLYSRTLESVYVELSANRKVLDSHVLSQFPLEQRLLSLDSTKLVQIDLKLKALAYDLDQAVGVNHSKVKVSIGVRASGSFFSRTTKVLFKNEKRHDSEDRYNT